MPEFAARGAGNIQWQGLQVSKADRAARLNQTPRCIWLTGLSGSGKTTLANCLKCAFLLRVATRICWMAHNGRHGLNSDLGFSETDRVENIRRLAETAKLIVDAGLIVPVSLISSFAAQRKNGAQAVCPSRVCRGVCVYAAGGVY